MRRCLKKFTTLGLFTLGFVISQIMVVVWKSNAYFFFNVHQVFGKTSTSRAIMVHKQRGKTRIVYTAESHDLVSFLMRIFSKFWLRPSPPKQTDVILEHSFIWTVTYLQLNSMEMNWTLDNYNINETTTIAELLSSLLNTDSCTGYFSFFLHLIFIPFFVY